MVGWRALRGHGGQVSVSLVAVVPALIVVVLAAVQFGLAGHAALSAANAARAAARASYAGADPSVAARAALPSSMQSAARVRELGDRAEVELEAPRALPFIPAITVSASAELGPRDGAPGG